MTGKLLHLYYALILALATVGMAISPDAHASTERATSRIIDVTFIDRLHGWALWETVNGDAHHIKLSGTSDGGRTWYPLASPHNGAHTGNLPFIRQ